MKAHFSMPITQSVTGPSVKTSYPTNIQGQLLSFCLNMPMTPSVSLTDLSAETLFYSLKMYVVYTTPVAEVLRDCQRIFIFKSVSGALKVKFYCYCAGIYQGSSIAFSQYFMHQLKGGS